MKTRTETFKYDDKGRVIEKTVTETETSPRAFEPIWVDPAYVRRPIYRGWWEYPQPPIVTCSTTNLEPQPSVVSYN